MKQTNMLTRKQSSRSSVRQYGTSFATNNPDTNSRHLKEIIENNKKWVEKKQQEDPLFFNRLTQTQKPKYLYFGCSDSRVPANQVMGLGPGDVFVHRNVGNIVPGNDLNALSVLEYAVEHLGVTDIIVCGHYECGAIKAALSRQDLGLLENWLREIRNVYRLHKDYLDLISDEDEKYHSLVELNVIEQCLNLYKTGVVQRKRIKTKYEFLNQSDEFKENKNMYDEIHPRIHGMVFDHQDGHLRTLKIDFKTRVGTLDHIYGLYDSKSPNGEAM